MFLFAFFIATTLIPTIPVYFLDLNLMIQTKNESYCINEAK